MIIPCFPISQSNPSFPFSKFTKNETEQDKFVSSASLIGENLWSLNALFRAKSGKDFDIGDEWKVPIHPRRSPFFFQVTKRGASKSWRPSGNGGRGLFFSSEKRTSKQYAQCFLVASWFAEIILSSIFFFQIYNFSLKKIYSLKLKKTRNGSVFVDNNKYIMQSDRKKNVALKEWKKKWLRENQ